MVLKDRICNKPVAFSTQRKLLPIGQDDWKSSSFICDTCVHLQSHLCDNSAFQPFQYIRERLLSLAHLSTHNFFRKSLYTQSACDWGEKLQGKWHWKCFQRRIGNVRQITMSKKCINTILIHFSFSWSVDHRAMVDQNALPSFLVL